MTLVATSPAVDAAPGRTTAEEEYQQLMSDLLHDLSQPLSTLTCLLEVNLLLSRPLKQVRHDLKIALQQVHGIVRLFRGLRELVDAGALQQDQERVSLTACLTCSVPPHSASALRRACSGARPAAIFSSVTTAT